MKSNHDHKHVRLQTYRFGLPNGGIYGEHMTYKEAQTKLQEMVGHISGIYIVPAEEMILTPKTNLMVLMGGKSDAGSSRKSWEGPRTPA